jgi:hypothetical protein
MASLPSLRREAFVEPRSRGIPVVDHGARGDTERVSGLFDAESTEETQQLQLAAEAVGLSPQDLAARGWDCRPTPIPNRVSCSPPNQMHPLLLPGPPPPADRPPTFTLLVFDNGVFIGTDLLIRSDLYRGQQCQATGAPYRFISRIGYYECLHPAGD